MIREPPRSTRTDTLFPYTTLFRSSVRKARVGPVEPRAEGFDIGGVDGRAAPDAKARRRVAITRDVVGRAFLFEQPGEFLDEIRIGARDRQAARGLRAARGIGGEVRSEERRAGKEGVSEGKTRVAPYL